MKIKNLSQTTGLSKNTIKTFKKDGLLGSNHDESTVLTAISCLMILRFSYEQIKTMHNSPDRIRAVVKKHIREMSNGDFGYPELCGLLGKIDLFGVRDIVQLGDRIKDVLFLPGDKAAQTEDIRKCCKNLQKQLKKVKKDYFIANIMDFFAMFPILGIPFGFARTFFLSRACDKMKVAYELNDGLSDSLSGLQPNLDIAYSESVNRFTGLSYDWARPNLSPGYYINETTTRIDMMEDRAFVINVQLNKLPIKSSTSDKILFG